MGRKLKHKSYEPKLTKNNKWIVYFSKYDFTLKETSRIFNSEEEARSFVLKYIPDAYDSKIETERKCDICNLILDVNLFSYHNGFVCKICTSNRDKERTKKRTQLGMCRNCNKPPIYNLTLCVDHWFIQSSRGNLKTPKYAQALKDLADKQNYRCAYTDVLLIPGVNMSLDHIISKYDNPDLITDINNVQWVDKDINIMKNKFSHDKFLEICKKICQKFK